MVPSLWVQCSSECDAVLRIKGNVEEIWVCHPGPLQCALSFLGRAWILDKIPAEQRCAGVPALLSHGLPFATFILFYQEMTLRSFCRRSFLFVLTCFCRQLWFENLQYLYMWNICCADPLPWLKLTSFFSVILVPGSLPWRLQASVTILTNFSAVSTVFLVGFLPLFLQSNLLVSVLCKLAVVLS